MSRPRRRAGNYADNEEEEVRSDPPFYETPNGQEDREDREDREDQEGQEDPEDQGDSEHHEDQEGPEDPVNQDGGDNLEERDHPDDHDHDDDPGLPAGTPAGNQSNHNDLLPPDPPSAGAQDRARGPLTGDRSAPRVVLQHEAARRYKPL